ncbi:MAG TPA: ABC transporter ATP-binding protein [Spirochaetia bacterium]|nr:ABC transporter ATP-binding protein [Spirochaetia bacterium]
MVAIETRSLRLRYGNAPALDGIDFSVHTGELFGLLGPNGAGKSTALKVLATILRPTSGSAHLMGIDVASHAGEARRLTGFIPQECGIDPSLTGLQNVYFHARIHGLSGRAARERARELLESVGLRGRGGEKARVYSGGMRKLLDIACAMVDRPRVILMDEPTLGLDPRSRRAVWDLVEDLRKAEGTAVLLTTHYLSEADALCDRVAILEHGCIAAQGTPGELRRATPAELVTVQMEGSADDLARARQGLAVLWSLKESTRGNKVCVAAVADAESAIPVIVETVRQAGARVVRTRVERRGLDGIFLDSTEEAPPGGGARR